MKKVNLGQLLTSVERLTFPVIQDETKKIIVQDKKILARKKDEMKAGIKPDGSIIGTYASPSYRLFKLQKNPIAGGNVDLILTGSTASKLGVDSLGNSVFKISSSDPKWNSLVSKYGSDIGVINQETFLNLQKFEYAPKLLKEMRRIMRL